MKVEMLLLYQLFSLSFLLIVPLVVVSATEKGECNLCPNGGEMRFPDRIIPSLRLPGNSNPTCDQAFEYAPYATSNSICQLIQAQAAYCGCPGHVKPDNSCQFCPNGEPPEFGDLVTATEATCDELYDYVSHLTHDECETERGQSILRQSFLCGCPFTTPTCAMCPDGSINVENPTNVVPFFNLNTGNLAPTCLEVAQVGAVSGSDNIDCAVVQQQAGFCGCKNVQPVGHCHLCPDGDVPTKLDLTTRTGDTCKALYNYMEFLDPRECLDSRRTQSIQSFAYICGCPGLEPSCSLCPDATDPPNPDQRAAPNGLTCGEANLDIFAYRPETCEGQRDDILAIGARCGCRDEFPVCSVNFNPDLCTHELLDTVTTTTTNNTTATCECYGFCDSEFVQCHDFPGGYISLRKCSGERISGCNRALAERNRIAAAAEREKEEQKQKEQEEESAAAAAAGEQSSAETNVLSLKLLMFLLLTTTRML